MDTTTDAQYNIARDDFGKTPHGMTARTRALLITLAVVVALGAIIYIVRHRTHTYTDAEVMQQLKESSSPFVTPVAERAKELDALSKNSVPVTLTTEERMSVFTQLQQKK